MKTYPASMQPKIVEAAKREDVAGIAIESCGKTITVCYPNEHARDRVEACLYLLF